ncbi:MAG TPA: hypothetical protein VE907_19695 [Gammaproteobacteria bacterium]|nr:hypothetical protein [Gammaproteobacteria bacterium]
MIVVDLSTRRLARSKARAIHCRQDLAERVRALLDEAYLLGLATKGLPELLAERGDARATDADVEALCDRFYRVAQ